VRDFCGEREAGLGAMDIKSFYLEPATDIADCIREALHYIAPEKV
jgi:methionine synthase II (cobalamin-independent)